jgi:hypothetical protein
VMVEVRCVPCPQHGGSVAEMLWSEVARVDGSDAGIATRDRKVVCWLRGQGKACPCPGRIEGDRLAYHVERETQGHGIQALFRLVKQPEPTRVFENLDVSRW